MFKNATNNVGLTGSAKSCTNNDAGCEDYVADISSIIYDQRSKVVPTFVYSKDINFLKIPVVNIQTVGRISYPLCGQQAVALQGVSTRASVGTQSETVVNSVWQVDGNFAAISTQWLEQSLPEMLTACCVQLGVDCSETESSC
jgi:hypothetical protein